jgi:hypothetical protein
MALRLITAPNAEPVTLQEAKDSLRVEGTDEDARITRHIINARRQAEAYTERQLVTATWELVLDAFPPVIRLRGAIHAAVPHVRSHLRAGHSYGSGAELRGFLRDDCSLRVIAAAVADLPIEVDCDEPTAVDLYEHLTAIERP